MSLRSQTLNAFKWSFLGNLFTYGSGFIISIILARLLTPEEFGVLGMAMVFVGISQSLMDVGFSSAVIQKKEVTQEQLSTVFYINLILSTILSVVLYLSAGAIARFYETPRLSLVVEVISLVFVFRGAGQLQMALFSKSLNYQVLTKIASVAVVISGTIAICSSYFDIGVWSLVIQQLGLALITTVLYWIYSDWRPSLAFNLRSVKDLFDYGIKLFFSSILEAVYRKVDSIIIGKLFTPTTLGLYSRSLSFQSLLIVLSTNGLQVLFPAFAKKQDDIASLRPLFFKIFSVVTLLSLFFSGLLYVIATPLFIILLGEQWVKAADYFKILMLMGYAYPLSSIAVNVIKALGESTMFLKLEVIKKIIMIPTFVVLFLYDIEWFLISKCFTALMSIFLNYYYVAKLLKFDLIDYFSTFSKSIALFIVPLILTDLIPIDTIYGNYGLIVCKSLLYISVSFLLLFLLQKKMVKQLLKMI